MPFTPTDWIDNVTPADAQHLNNTDTQYTEASQSVTPNLLLPFVLWGMGAAKDGTTASQLDVGAGTYFALQSDSTLRRREQVAANYTTSVASTTYYLDANPDGTMSWGTAHSTEANYLTICQVTTDVNANILTVTDERNPSTTFLPSSMGGVLTFVDTVAAPIFELANNGAYLSINGNALGINPKLSGTTAQGVYIASWNGSAAAVPLSIGAQYIGALCWFDNTGTLHMTGNSSDSGMVQLINTETSGHTWDIFVRTAGIGNDNAITFYDATSGNGLSIDTSANILGLVGSGIPTTRNGAATSVPIYTGTTTTPSSPPTGSIWVKA